MVTQVASPASVIYSPKIKFKIEKFYRMGGWIQMGKQGNVYGSQWHLLRYLGYHRNLLTRKVIRVTNGNDISWLDFKFAKGDKPSYEDSELMGIEFIKVPQVKAKWKTFWPQSGRSQNWDAVGEIDYGDHKEWLLVEAKAHKGELKGSPCKADEKSRKIIATALEKVIPAFCDRPMPVETWLGDYYQYANRLAMLYFLMKECDPPVHARLLFIYFLGDDRLRKECPKKKDDWKPAIREVEESLGINPERELYQRVHRKFLYVNPNRKPE